MTISEKENRMADVEIEYYNGETALFTNARYGRRGEKFVITRNGVVNFEIGAAYVYGVRFVAPRGSVQAPERARSAVFGKTRTRS